ncbi:MAG: ACP S-malonyltransferase [Candidatus Lariskella arthropodorum]
MIDSANTSLLFPGQGSQHTGMGRELYETFEEAREVFLTVDEVLQQNLSKLMFEGDANELTATENAQPAIMAVSIAVLRVLLVQLRLSITSICSVMAGHSLGEYSALCAAGVFSLENTAALLRIRGNAMNKAASNVKGGMVALIGADLENVEKMVESLRQFGLCEIANDNGAGQIVISGEMKAMEKAVELASQFSIKKAVQLNVSAPFHSSLMTDAAITMQKSLSQVVMSAPVVPVIANYSASAVSDVEQVSSMLVKQVGGRVRWRETIEKCLCDYKIINFIEVGPGQVLTTLAKRMSSGIRVFNLDSPNSIERFVESIL